MEIIIGQGINEIRFGLTQAQAIELLGEPDKTYELEGSTRWQYFDSQIELSFEKEHEDKMGWIEIKNPDALLFNLKLIGESAETVLSVVADNIADEPEHDDYGNLETYYYNDQQLEFQFEMNRLRSINSGFLWLDNDTPRWP